VQRHVEPEILDTLSPDDPEAVASRRDLRRINGLMCNHRWLEQRVRALRKLGWRVLELGAGDGTFGKRLLRNRVVEPSGLLAVDLAPRPADWPREARWLQQDVFTADLPAAEIVIANLFLHHFEPAALRELGKRLPAACRVLLCSEPARRPLHLWQSRLLALLPLGRVTRHDMPVSIRAGFVGHELPSSLGISGWNFTVSTTFFGAYRLEAHRR
jgi:SAM-dependent methyltransferase